MNEKKAKTLRRRVYGEASLKEPRRYLWDVNRKEGVGGVVAQGRRREYQDAKKVQP
jgi:hypothetical protein